MFIKNIDNVVPDRLKKDTVIYKNVLAGILVKVQQQVFEYLKRLDSCNCSIDELTDMLKFVRQTLCVTNDGMDGKNADELAVYLRKKLNRPMRVCQL